MEEVVRRRYRKVLEEGGPFPDLILIDGGKGQLTAAYAALHDLGLANLIAIGIAKKEELLFTRDRDQPIALADNDPALLLLQQIRDEAHRFAVTFHRKARSMRDLHSAPRATSRCRRTASAHAAHEVRQSGGRGGGRHAKNCGHRSAEKLRCGSCVFRKPDIICTPLPDIDSRGYSFCSSFCFFP
jgi:pimeloyl-ACP methyl ester carboxylesterase